MKRFLFALFLALTGLMMVAAPVAVMAMSGSMLCEQQASVNMQHAAQQPSTASMDHSHHGADHGMHQVVPTSDEASTDSVPICCNHACVAELTVMPAMLGSSQIASSAPHDLSSSDLTELTEPNGLRRPPKA
ncbi:hypothetical protein KUW14_03360 [Pseudooceanicola nitratireducens]|uniref:hypothetical protein n=1 Tax=Pseudooceanicola nitratireducens TaxID=517719 RepID=UPI001C93BA05|nr:hypothetical protein [Pseudooceanicola nitratireducens]MBY6164877.1 hypothetical protein [Pseudooceanicola nitratireducens]